MKLKLLFILFISLSTALHAADLKIDLHKAIAGKIDRPFMGVFLVTKGDDIIYQQVHGKFAQYPLSSQFIMGSISKQFTATIILRLVDQGLIDLDKPIKTYLPDLKNDWATIVTVRQLLNHSSGIKDLESPLEFTPGSQTKYVRIFPYYLASIIATKVSGKDYQTLLNEIFSIASMFQSGMVVSENMNENRLQYPLLPRAFKQNNNGLIEEIHSVQAFDSLYNPCGGVISTAQDLANWQNSLHNGKLLSPQSYQQMITIYGSIPHHAYDSVGYGLGLQLIERDGFLEISHHGYGAGYVSTIFYYPNSKISIIALENVAHNWTIPKRIFANHDALRDVVRNHIKNS